MAVARAALNRVELLPSVHELNVARAQLAQANAQFQLSQYYLDQLRPLSPHSLRLEQLLVRLGEQVQTGTLLAILSDPQDFHVMVHASTLQVAEIQIGQSVIERSDAYPQEDFQGKLSAIADTAQFKPSNVQTGSERVKLVFAV